MDQQAQQSQFVHANGASWQAPSSAPKPPLPIGFDIAAMYTSQMFPFASSNQGGIHPNAVKVENVGTSFNGNGASKDEDVIADDDDDVQQDGEAPKAKRTRKRQQTSCTECHRRKQKCNREIPCDRCIKRGTAHTCQIMIVGELTDTSADMSINTSSAAINAAKQTSQKRKRKMDGDIDLAARVEQLEHFLRMQQSAQNASFAHAAQLVSPGIQQTPAIDGSMRSTPSGISYVPPSIPQMLPTGRLTPSTSTKDVPVPKKNGVNGQSAVEEEEDAAAALGQLSKAVSKEGGTEARIYSGPGSIADLLSSSAFGRDGDVQEERYMRVRPCELSLYKGGQPSLAAMASAPAHMRKLADELQEQKAKLPPPQMSHFLFDAVFNLPMFADRNRIFPRTCIQVAYDGLWSEADRDTSPSAEAARAAGYPQLASSNSLAFLSLVYVLLSSALLMQPGTMKDPESQHLASVLYEASRAAFMASERREQPTYAVIVAIMSQAAWLKIAGCPSLGFTYIAQAVRFAQSMGLHREVPPSWDLGGFEIEIRRRLWHMLLCADRGHSISYGRPYMIIAKHCDVTPPSNIYDKDLRPEGPVNIRPLDECTHSTFQRCAVAMAGVMAEVIDRAFSCTAPTYSTILELDNLLTKTEHESVPLAFKNPSITDMIEKPYLKDQYVAYQIQACWLRALLHRPYLLRPLPKAKEPDHYAGSRAAAVMLSQRMISLSKDVLANVAAHHQAYFGYAFNLFEPAVNLAMAIIQDPGSANATAIDSYVSDAIQMLDAMSGVNKVASEGLSTLRYLQSKYTAAINAAKAASPSTVTTHSSMSKPSPLSLAYSSSGPSPSSASDMQPFGRAAHSNGSSGASTAPTSAYLSTPQYKGPEAAPTPNTLFNQFFNQYNQYSGMTPAAVTQSDPLEAFSFDKLFNLNPAIYNNDPEAAWLTQPIEGGLAEQWPMTMPRLEGETNFDDWTKSLGLNG